MTKPYPLLLTLFLITSLIISGCASKPDKMIPSSELSQTQTYAQRAKQLQQKKQWQLRGKIAFIQKVKDKKDKRESASIAWQVDEEQHSQELNLTSYLGVNVFHLQSKGNQHLIEVNGEQYHGTNLPFLVYELTDFPLPTKALTYWLKGLPYQENDRIILDDTTQLPSSLFSDSGNGLWKINYSNYHVFNGIKMATKFSITKGDLLIKIMVKQWSLTDLTTD